MEISGDLNLGELVVNSHAISAPLKVDRYVEIRDVAVLQLAPDVDYENEGPDFDLPEPGRNVVAIDGSANVVWTVSDAPSETDCTDTNLYEYVFQLTGALFARDVEKRLYEIDPGSGEVVRTLDDRTLPIAGMDVSIGGWVNKVVEFGEYVVVDCGGLESPSLYGFDRQGTELWRAEERRGSVFWDGSVLIERVERGPRLESHYFYRLDPDTGERLAEIEVEYVESGFEYVEDISEDV